MSKTIDILFIQSDASEVIYQGLSKDYSAIEPPIWAGMLCQSTLVKGYAAEILDCEALHMNDDEALYHIKNLQPRIACFVVYGQQPSASSQNMEGAVRLAEKIKQTYPQIKILFVGGHVAALPRETLERHPFIDMVCQNEGVYTIHNLLQVADLDNLGQLSGVLGLGWTWNTTDKKREIVLNSPSPIVPKERLHIDLPGMAWDKLPMRNYRTSSWHSNYIQSERQPFAALYTSLNCPFGCTFCCISAPFGGSGFKYWDPEFMITEFDKIAKRGIKNIKIADEMFVMTPDHFMKLCALIIERKYNFNIWAYARVDITKSEYLDTLKKAGVNWLALGIESSNKRVRKDVYKGRFENTDIEGIVKNIRNAGINVMGNYIFGLPEDDMASMQETLELAISMNTEAVNFYSAMCYPGSKLYYQAIENNWKLPEKYAGYSQHSYYSQNLPSKYLSAAQILKFRDEAFQIYHTNSSFLNLIDKKFGEKAVNNIKEMSKIKLKRKILDYDKL